MNTEIIPYVVSLFMQCLLVAPLVSIIFFDKDNVAKGEKYPKMNYIYFLFTSLLVQIAIAGGFAYLSQSDQHKPHAVNFIIAHYVLPVLTSIGISIYIYKTREKELLS